MHVAVAGKRLSSDVHAKKSVIYMPLSVSDWPIIMIGPGGLLLVVPRPICCPSFSFIGGIAKEYITKLGCENYFRSITYRAPLEMHLVYNCKPKMEEGMSVQTKNATSCLGYLHLPASNSISLLLDSCVQ